MITIRTFPTKISLSRATNYFFLFIFLCWSGNPLFTDLAYSKQALVIYSAAFILYTVLVCNIKFSVKFPFLLSVIISIIGVIIIAQQILFDFISVPGILAIILKITYGGFMLVYFKARKDDFLHYYIRLMSFLSVISILFFLLNFTGHYGMEINQPSTKSLLFYTSLILDGGGIRNSGMFWEPGAFAGYLIIALLFIAFRNRTFSVGPYKRETFWIIIAMLTTLSTTAFFCLALLFMAYLINNFSFRIKFMLIPVCVTAGLIIYENMPFLSEKIELQYQQAENMDKSDVSNTRFGALKMDLQYIEAEPIFGNGVHIKTRYRFHPSVKGDIGHGNGMSNFITCWGIPLFLFWLLQFYLFARNKFPSRLNTLLSVLIILLLLQGEQFLNYPFFLSFFLLPVIFNKSDSGLTSLR